MTWRRGMVVAVVIGFGLWVAVVSTAIDVIRGPGCPQAGVTFCGAPDQQTPTSSR